MQQTIDFLQKLKSNNNREWFESHREAYEASQTEMIALADQILVEMNQHDVIETPTGKKSLYRIYRDVRFGKDKTPYKTHWAGRFKRAGANRRGGYYYHIGIHEAYVIGGFFNPNAKDLLHIRNHLAQDAEPLRAVINSQNFKSTFGHLLGEQLKTAPKGFDKEHPDIDLLRHKQFIVKHEFQLDEIKAVDFPIIISNAFREMRPFFDCMTEMLTTDLNGISLI